MMAGLREEIEPRRMPRALQLENPLVVAYARNKPATPVSQGATPQPAELYLMSFFVRTGTGVDPEYVVRLQNIVEHGRDIAVDLDTLFPGVNITAWEEVDLALDTPHPRRAWGGQVPPAARTPLAQTRVTVSAIDMRTFIGRTD